MTSSPPHDWPRRVTILGVGLLGGSVGMAIKRSCASAEVVGYSRTEQKRELAIQCGAVDRTADSIPAACEGADVVIVASLVDQIAPMAIDAAAATDEHCLITDVGSTKATIVQCVAQDAVAHRKFVAAHPIAGSEKTGVTHASKTLFDQKVIVLTPSDDTAPERTQRAKQFWQLTGGTIMQLSPAQHDAYLAAVSHVPHLVSAALCQTLPLQAGSLVGSGWRDITRVAAGDPSLWAAICAENRQAISSELQRLIAELQGLAQMLEKQDDAGVQQWLADAKRSKESVP